MRSINWRLLIALFVVFAALAFFSSYISNKYENDPDPGFIASLFTQVDRIIQWPSELISAYSGRFFFTGLLKNFTPGMAIKCAIFAILIERIDHFVTKRRKARK